MIKAESLAEVLVASLIFLLIFAIGLSSITKITLQPKDRCNIIEADFYIRKIVNDCINGHIKQDSSVQCKWGYIKINLEPYKDYQDLQKVEITATLIKEQRKIIRTQIIKRYE
jgi:hypothetical protein